MFCETPLRSLYEYATCVIKIGVNRMKVKMFDICNNSMYNSLGQTFSNTQFREKGKPMGVNLFSIL